MSSKSPMLFINLAITSLDTALPFYTSLGFIQNKKFSNDSTAMVSLAPLSESGDVGTINVMLHQHESFKMFLPSGRSICDAKASTEVLLCLSSESRDGVDDMVAKAKAAGGELDIVPLPKMEGMYGRSFTDLDGHVWEVMWMSDEAVAKHGEE